MESKLDLTKILKDAGCIVLQRRPVSASTINYAIQRHTLNGWIWVKEELDFATAKMWLADQPSNYQHRIVAIVEVK